MIGYVTWIVRMAILQFRDERLKCVEHVEVGARVEISRHQRCCGVQNGEMADAVLFRAQCQLNGVRDVNDLALLCGLE